MMKEIERFFLPPGKKCPDEKRPLLFLLRRDLVKLYGNEGSNRKRHVTSPLLTSLGIMVGLELLAKLWSGEVEAGHSTIVDFLVQVAELSPERAEALAQFRHAIAHGYRLKTRVRSSGNYYYFYLSDSKSANELLKRINSHRFKINVWKLKDFFISTIYAYRRVLLLDKKRMKNFDAVREKIGDIEIRRGTKIPET